MYTKGKWQDTEDGVIVAEDGKQIASVFPRDREANAHLIAAAPALVEALEDVLSVLGRANVLILTSKEKEIYARGLQALASVKGEGK